MLIVDLGAAHEEIPGGRERVLPARGGPSGQGTRARGATISTTCSFQGKCGCSADLSVGPQPIRQYIGELFGQEVAGDLRRHHREFRASSARGQTPRERPAAKDRRHILQTTAATRSHGLGAWASGPMEREPRPRAVVAEAGTGEGKRSGNHPVVGKDPRPSSWNALWAPARSPRWVDGPRSATHRGCGCTKRSTELAIGRDAARMCGFGLPLNSTGWTNRNILTEGRGVGGGGQEESSVTRQPEFQRGKWDVDGTDCPSLGDGRASPRSRSGLCRHRGTWRGSKLRGAFHFELRKLQGGAAGGGFLEEAGLQHAGDKSAPQGGLGVAEEPVADHFRTGPDTAGASWVPLGEEGRGRRSTTSRRSSRGDAGGFGRDDLPPF